MLSDVSTLTAVSPRMMLSSVIVMIIADLFIAVIIVPRAGSRVERIDLLRFLTGCHKR